MADVADLERIQAESERQALPEQERVFRVAKRISSKLHNLPDPTNPPLGFTPGKGFDEVFPFIRLPHLAPNLNGDWVQFGSPELEPNRLYYGDNLQVLRTLPSNSIDLIYIDPPFFSGADYNVIWGDTNEVRTFSDIWEGGMPTYLVWLNARLWEMRRILKATGSIYVHCDWHASHYIKAEMDKIFGYENFQNEIIWQRTSARSDSHGINHIHDVILCFSKSGAPHYNIVHTAYDEKYISDFYRHVEPITGRRFRVSDITAAGTRRGETGKPWRGIDPNRNGRHWSNEPAELDRLDAIGRIFWPQKDGGIPGYKRYLDEMEGVPLQSIWTDISPVAAQSLERIGYPTQKPESLMDRIISASTNEGDLVADFFIGGGSTAAVAERLGRRWLVCDSSRIAVSVTLNRLVKVGEEMTGVCSNFGPPGQAQASLDLPSDRQVPDIRVHYVGVYPMDRFKAVDQPTFDEFVLKCLGAQIDNSDNPITGWRSGREPLKIGPADPDVAPDPRDLQAFFEACLKHLKENVKLAPRYVCWRTSPELVAYRKRLSEYVKRNVQTRGADMDLDFLLIDSESFRERVRQKYPDADDSEFLLRFTKEPIIGEIACEHVFGPRKYKFEALDADSANVGGYLVNCQWDFDYQRGHFAAHRDYVLSRGELKGKEAKLAGRKFEAILVAEHQFANPGPVVVACRVQDNFGAEAIRTLEVEVA